MVNVSFCRLGRRVPAPFAGYMLPTAAAMLAQEDENVSFTVLGAMWDSLACGTAVAIWREDGGEILSLFVDPKARHYGIAGRLVDLLTEEGAARGADSLRCSYVLKGDELISMDGLFLKRKAMIENGSPICGIASADVSDSPLLGPALRPGWRRNKAVRLFSELTQEQREEIETEETLPGFLRPSALGMRLDPSLSAAWIAEEKVTAFVAAFQSGDRMFSQSSVWRGPDAPEGSFRVLICTQVNQCWYRAGGGFTFFISPINPSSARMTEWFTGGKYEVYGNHEAIFPIETAE